MLGVFHVKCGSSPGTHGETGDGCWNEKICRRRRSHYRHRADNNQKRKGQYALTKAELAQQRQAEQAQAALVVKPPVPPVALLYLYREPRKDAHLHAIAVAVWQGDQKLEQTLAATHCVGMTNSEVTAYLLKILGDLRDRYGIQKFKQEIRYDPCFCPIHPCPLKPELGFGQQFSQVEQEV